MIVFALGIITNWQYERVINVFGSFCVVYNIVRIVKNFLYRIQRKYNYRIKEVQLVAWTIKLIIISDARSRIKWRSGTACMVEM